MQLNVNVNLFKRHLFIIYHIFVSWHLFILNTITFKVNADNGFILNIKSGMKNTFNFLD